MTNININTGIDMDTGLRVTPPQFHPITGHGGNLIKAEGELSECARLHEEEVITNDSYHLKELYRKDQDIHYVVDIGANVGAFSFYIHQLYPKAKIISCAPEEKCMEYTKANTNNELVYVNKAIVGDPDLKEVKFNICRWAGNHHVDGKFDMETYSKCGTVIENQIVVPAITLQKVVDDNKFPRIDLLKIDTEGSEVDVLEGIRSWHNNVKYILRE